MVYESRIQLLGQVRSFSQKQFRLEQSQARTSIAEAEQAGPAHRAFIESLPIDWQADPGLEIFSRLVYLKQGWFPLAPRFHFDWGGRNDANDRPVETLMVLHGESSRTEFILGPLEHPTVPRSMPTVGRSAGADHWQEQVQTGLANGTLTSWSLAPNILVKFDNHTLHRARPAEKAGWRLLIRAIRGLDGRCANPGSFSCCRNGFVPTNDSERERLQQYQN